MTSFVFVNWQDWWCLERCPLPNELNSVIIMCKQFKLYWLQIHLLSLTLLPVTCKILCPKLSSLHVLQYFRKTTSLKQRNGIAKKAVYTPTNNKLTEAMEKHSAFLFSSCLESSKLLKQFTNSCSQPSSRALEYYPATPFSSDPRQKQLSNQRGAEKKGVTNLFCFSPGFPHTSRKYPALLGWDFQLAL